MSVVPRPLFSRIHRLAIGHTILKKETSHAFAQRQATNACLCGRCISRRCNPRLRIRAHVVHRFLQQLLTATEDGSGGTR